MNNNSEKEQVIIEREVYCPYCEKNGAFLISEMTNSSSEIKFSKLGCKNAMLFGCMGGCWGFVKGYSILTKNRTYKYRTYGFCPHCGNIYNATVEEDSDEK